MKTLGFIGGGRITRILLQAFKNANIQFDITYVYETNEIVLNALKSKYPYIMATNKDAMKAASADLVFIALHPSVLMDALQTLKNSINKHALVVSLAPKITIERLLNALPGITNIARMNPNASTIVNKGVNPIAFSSDFSAGMKNILLKLLQPLGFTPEVSEAKIEAYAIISAMGPTYFWFQMQELVKLAKDFGMAEQEARETVELMITGATETYFHSGLEAEDVKDLVPVKPLADDEPMIKNIYQTKLPALFKKIKP